MSTAVDPQSNPNQSRRRSHVVRRLVKARELIERAFDQPLTLSDLAAEACMSDAHFVRQFRDEFGITPYRYLTERRLAAARDLLANTRMPVADIVVETGFGNRSAFSRLFKSRCGLSPQAYRVSQRRLRNNGNPSSRRLSGVAAATLSLLLAFSAAAQDDDAQQPHAEPCATANHRSFDFWLGSWAVYQGDQLAGHNRIELTHNGCVLQENWTASNGSFTGSSLNLYDRARGKWHQSWADSSGGLLQLDGALQDGQMVLSGQRPARDGSGPVTHQISWTPNDDGTVRQLWRTRKGDDDWQVLFDGLYKPSE